MRFYSIHIILANIATAIAAQTPLLLHAQSNRTVSAVLFSELEELARIVDITYCVGLTSIGIFKPFNCLSRCSDFPAFELVTTWNTGPFLSDSCGYIALDHGKGRVIVAFRGTYSVANTVVDLSTIPQKYVPYPGEDGGGVGAVDVGSNVAVGARTGLGRIGKQHKDVKSKCEGCTVHMGFYRAWHLTRAEILQALQEQLYFYPDYKLHLVGHSLGGAVAALAALDLQGRGWEPTVTTFGEPRIGNEKLVEYLGERFNLSAEFWEEDDTDRLTYRRVTHIDDPVPLLPLTEWGYAMHAGEIFISKPDLSPDIDDLAHCEGDNDQHCIAGQDSTTSSSPNATAAQKRDLLASIQGEVQDVVNEPWGIPSRYKLWQLFFAHRDYFWRLGLCVPGGDPMGGGGKYEDAQPQVEL